MISAGGMGGALVSTGPKPGPAAWAYRPHFAPWRRWKAPDRKRLRRRNPLTSVSSHTYLGILAAAFPSIVDEQSSDRRLDKYRPTLIDSNRARTSIRHLRFSRMAESGGGPRILRMPAFRLAGSQFARTIIAKYEAPCSHAVPLLLMLSASLLAPAFGQAKRPMQFDDLMKMHRLGGFSVSPNGKWVVYAVTDADLDKNTKTTRLWVIPAAGGEAKPLTASIIGENGGRFSPDGKHVLFTSAREGSQQVYVAPFNDATGMIGEQRKVTSISTEADGAIWAPDRSRSCLSRGCFRIARTMPATRLRMKRSLPPR